MLRSTDKFTIMYWAIKLKIPYKYKNGFWYCGHPKDLKNV